MGGVMFYMGFRCFGWWVACVDYNALEKSGSVAVVDI